MKKLLLASTLLSMLAPASAAWRVSLQSSIQVAPFVISPGMCISRKPHVRIYKPRCSHNNVSKRHAHVHQVKVFRHVGTYNVIHSPRLRRC